MINYVGCEGNSKSAYYGPYFVCLIVRFTSLSVLFIAFATRISVSYTTFASLAQYSPLHSRWPLQWSSSLLSAITSGRRTWICSYSPKDYSDSQWRQRKSQFIMLTKKSTGIGLMKPTDAYASQYLETFSSTSRRFGIILIPYLTSKMI